MPDMKICTWNVNSLRVRLSQVLDWIELHKPDAVCLQETKTQDDVFPRDDFLSRGYALQFSGQKTYNGVAIIAAEELGDPVTQLPGFDDPQRRVLAATCGAVRIVNVYVPNGSEVGSEKYHYKLAWLEQLLEFLKQQIQQHEHVVVTGDFNIAPADEDVHDPELWKGKILCSEPERAMFQRLVQLGFEDTFRKFDQEPGVFSWWDYRAAAFRRNMGLRIDHILATGALTGKCTASFIDKEPRKAERPSDHAPAVAKFSI